MSEEPLEMLRRLCLSLPEAREVVAWGAPTFRPDAGIEQQAFQLLERAEVEVDWTCVEQIDELVRSET